MSYVDGFLVPVPIAKMAEYRALASKAGKVWREHGALAYFECVGDDVPPGKVTSFPMSVKLEEGETVVFSWIVYESREHRDRVNALAMQDPRLNPSEQPEMPFDGKRMIYGGFKVMIGLDASGDSSEAAD